MLTPYLFLLCVEGVSRMHDFAEHQKAIKDVATSINGTKISKLLFADDSIFFCEAKAWYAGEKRRFYRFMRERLGRKLKVRSWTTLEIDKFSAMSGIWDCPWL